MHTRQVKIGRQMLTIETGKLAKQADGAVTVRYGDTVVLATACYAPHERQGIDFLPLTVDYRENTYPRSSRAFRTVAPRLPLSFSSTLSTNFLVSSVFPMSM